MGIEEDTRSQKRIASNEATPTTAAPLEVDSWKHRAPMMSAPIVPVAKATSKMQEWNTKDLGARLGTDALAAASAGVLVAPIITMIDRGIIENASGRNTLGGSILQSLKTLLLRPHTFVFSKPFALVFSLYTGTYLTANLLDTTSSTLSFRPASTVTAGAPKFAATSAANLTLCLYKDRHFTQLFGSPANSAGRVPLPTYALFTLRDCLTIFASFNLPPLLAPRLPLHVWPALERNVSQASTAQFLAPAAVQLFSTPLHLLGLDVYNRRNGVTLAERFRKIRGEWAPTVLARMGRIVPAFGVGGVVNGAVRRKFMERL